MQTSTAQTSTAQTSTAQTSTAQTSTAQTSTAQTRPPWTNVRRIAGWGAALAMLPYLIVKIFWTVDGLRGGGLHDGAWSSLNWAVINGLTVGMAGIAIVLGLALAQPWGMRVPGWLLIFPAWIGAGFLVPMLPLLPILLLLTTGGGGATADDAALPAREIALLSASFAGFGLGTVIAVPLYALHRWPGAFTRRTVSTAGSVELTTAKLVAVACTVLGLPQLYWALGGTLGLNQAALDQRDTQWHLLTGNSGLWAVIAAWGIWTVTHRRAGPAPLLLTGVASGFLFAWGSWKAAFAFAVTPGFPPPELPWMLALQNHFGALAGLTILLLVLLRGERRLLPAVP